MVIEVIHLCVSLLCEDVRIEEWLLVSEVDHSCRDSQFPRAK